jgi:hypothetical protein
MIGRDCANDCAKGPSQWVALVETPRETLSATRGTDNSLLNEHRRGESGEDKREFAEGKNSNGEETMTSVHELEQNRQVYSGEGADAVI